VESVNPVTVEREGGSSDPSGEALPGATHQIWILGLLGAICIALEIGVHLFLRTAIGYTHIFYVLLVLAGVWYYQKALVVAAALVAATFLTSGIVGDFTWATLLRAAMFLVVTWIVAKISEERDRAKAEILDQKAAIEEKHSALVGYLAEVALRMKNPIHLLRDNMAAIRLQLESEDPDLEAVKMDLSVQITHADQIMANFRELNQAIVEERDEIPLAYRDFLTR
jgi:hypothetical protein